MKLPAVPRGIKKLLYGVKYHSVVAWAQWLHSRLGFEKPAVTICNFLFSLGSVLSRITGDGLPEFQTCVFVPA